MKNTNLIYWIITGLFSAFMLVSGIPDAMLSPEAKAFVGHLGYPDYFIVFIGVAKILGALAVIVPVNFPRIKEWAYAGLFYDLFAAIISQLATDGFQPGIFFMALPIGFCFASYFLHHKRLVAAN